MKLSKIIDVLYAPSLDWDTKKNLRKKYRSVKERIDLMQINSIKYELENVYCQKLNFSLLSSIFVCTHRVDCLFFRWDKNSKM